MKVYVTRHGQTKWNLQNKVLGRKDMELTETGLSQAEALAEKLRFQKIDIILSSPLSRAYKTAEKISMTTGADIEVDERLIEQDYGTFEGYERDDKEYLFAKKQFATKMPGGESILQIAHRIYSFLDELKTREDIETVCIVAHGSVTRVLDTYFHDRTQEEFFAYLIGNCECREYDL